jgi:DNA-binding CsgD family transcriptional regulator
MFYCFRSAKFWGFAHAFTAFLQLGLLTASEHLANPFLTLPGKKFGHVYLSTRESQCLHFFAKGKTAKMIAGILKLSPRTVEHYLENAKIKLNASSKAELIDIFLIQNFECLALTAVIVIFNDLGK